MRLESHRQPITSLAEWGRLAPPKSAEHWTEGRSAFELARAWCAPSGPAMPTELRALLEGSESLRGLKVECAFPEHRIRFDARSGEPRNADLAFVGHRGDIRVAFTVEAKADEPFGATVEDTIRDAVEGLMENPRSGGIQRVAGLAQSLFRRRDKRLPFITALRYQLLTAAAGSLAFAVSEGAAMAVLIVHEFVTDRTQRDLHQRNARDFEAFLTRLGGEEPKPGMHLHGPFEVPGIPLFEKPPPLLVGKVVTNRK